jgi:hypothetical protein
LKEPLLTFKYYDTLLKIGSIESNEEKINKFKSVFNDLPKNNMIIFRKLMKLLIKINENSNENFMSFTNLGMIFGISILRSNSNDQMKIALDLSKVNRTMLALFELFPKYLE